MCVIEKILWRQACIACIMLVLYYYVEHNIDSGTFIYSIYINIYVHFFALFLSPIFWSGVYWNGIIGSYGYFMVLVKLVFVCIYKCVWVWKRERETKRKRACTNFSTLIVCIDMARILYVVCVCIKVENLIGSICVHCVRRFSMISIGRTILTVSAQIIFAMVAFKHFEYKFWTWKTYGNFVILWATKLWANFACKKFFAMDTSSYGHVHGARSCNEIFMKYDQIYIRWMNMQTANKVAEEHFWWEKVWMKLASGSYALCVCLCDYASWAGRARRREQFAIVLLFYYYYNTLCMQTCRWFCCFHPSI